MNCHNKRFHDMIFDYVDGNLNTEAVEAVTIHLADCSECYKLETEYRQTIAGLEVVLENTARDHITDDILITYIDNPGALQIQEKSAVELHISICDVCNNKAEMLQRVAQEESFHRDYPILDWLRSPLHNVYYFIAHKPVAGIVAIAAIASIILIYWFTIGRDFGPGIRFTSAQDVIWLGEVTRGDQIPWLSDSTETARTKPDYPPPPPGYEGPWPPPDSGLSEFDQAPWSEDGLSRYGQTLLTVDEINGRAKVGVPFYAFFNKEKYQIQLQTSEDVVLQKIWVKKSSYYDQGVRLLIETTGLDPGEYRLVLISYKLEDEKITFSSVYPFLLVKD